jgi:hypothetical protein
VATKWSFLDKFYIQPELTFIQKGGDISNRIVKVNQLEIATLIGYEVQLKSISFYINSGVFLGRVLSLSKDEDPFANAAITLSSHDEDWDWGFVYGIGTDMKIGVGRLGFEARYRMSQNDFRYTTQGTLVGGSIPNPSFFIFLKNRGWGLNLSYRVPFKMSK